MKFLKHGLDGGPESTVEGWWLAEIKSAFSVVLLKFHDGSRDQFHSHAFGSLNWVLRGRVREEHLHGTEETHTPSVVPVVTKRSTFHRVVSVGDTWVLSIRGPWRRTWMEYDPASAMTTVLESGRRVVMRLKGRLRR